MVAKKMCTYLNSCYTLYMYSDVYYTHCEKKILSTPVLVCKT